MDRHARAVVVSSPLSAVKDQASLPTEAPGPLREAEEGRQALERLYRVALAMQTSWGREERLGAFIHGAHEVVDFDRVSVLLATPDGTGLELVRTHGEKGTIPPAILPLSRSAGPFYQAFQTRRPVAVLRDEDLGKIVPLDSGYQSHPSFRTTRFVIAPLIVGGRTIGVAGADNKPSRRPISPASIEPFTLLCQLLAVALEETRLHLETRAREQETTLLCTGLTLLNQASRALQRTLNVDGMLNNALGELARSFGAGTVFVDLLSESGDVERRVGDWLSEAHGRDLSRSGGRASEFVQLTRAPLVLRDITERPDIVHPAHFAHGVKSLVAFPVVGQEHRVLGVLFLCYQVPQRFPDSEIHLLSAYSDQLAMALENAQLYEESERRRREAEVLAELTGTLNASLDVRTVLGRVLEGAKELCRSDLARVALREAGSDALVVRHWLGPRRPWYETTRIEPGKGVGGRVLRTGRPFRTAHYAEDPRISKDYLELAREMGVVAGMAVPIRIDGRVDGVLFVDNCSPRPFTDRDEAFLLRVADHAAIAIKNARLYEEATRRRREAEEMGRVARMLTESLDVSALSERIVQSVLHLFGARSSGLRLLQPDGSLLAIAAGDPSRAHSWLGHVLPSGMGISGRVVAARGAIQCRDVLNEPDFVLTDEMRRRIVASGDRAFLAVPLRVKTEIIGVLSVADRGGRLFSEAEVALLQAFADQAALAIRNAQMFAREQEARTQAEVSEQRFRGLVQDLDAIVWEADAVTWQFAFVSQRAEAILGCPVEQWLTEPEFWVNRLHPDDRERTVALRCAAISEGRDSDLEYRCVAADGCVVWLRDRVRVVRDASGQARQLRGVMVDITQRKRLQEDLTQAEKLATLGEMIAGIAHELNNPLAALTGHAQLLRTEHRGAATEGRVERLLQAAQRASRVVQNFLTFARKHRPETVAVSVNDVITKTLEFLAYQLRVNNIEVQTALTPDLPFIAADPHQLQQVLVNLLNNASQAMATAGRGTLRVVSGLNPDGATIGVTVGDDGPGIPPESLSRIFDPFFTTKSPGEGTGLGLAIARGIVTEHGGTITVESELGEGATFVVTLPIPQISPVPRPPVEPRAIPTGLRVLVVDDEESLRELIADALADQGNRVETTAEGREALELLAGSPVDVLVLDVRMPGMSGTDLWTEINRTNPLLARRTVFCTGSVVGEKTRTFLDSTGCPTVAKPFELSHLFDAVARAASQ